MKFKGKKQNSQGFTLAELLIVVAIIAVLVAVSIPIFTSRLEHSREVVCENNRKTLVHQIWYERMSDDSFSQKDAAALIKESDAYCPSLGSDKKYTLKTFNEFIVAVECSKHGGTGSGGGNVAVTPGQELLSNFQNFIKNYSGLKNNDSIREDFFKTYGNDPVLIVDGKEYYIEPFYKTQSDNDVVTEDRTWLFARDKNNRKNTWSAQFIYNVKEGKWYSACHSYDGRLDSRSIDGFMSTEELDTAVRNATYENGQKIWKEVTSYEESWNKD